MLSLGGLPSDLLDLDDDEFCRLERGEADQDVDDAVVLVGGRGGFAVALDEVGLLRRGALEGALGEERLHEGADVEADLAPEGSIVGLEDNPLRSTVEAGFEEEGEAPDGDVFPLRAGFVIAASGARPPYDRAVGAEGADAVDGD